jgi:hypothetical protein
LIFVLTSSFFTRLGIIVSWELNRTYIAQNLCEKRAEKNNCCKGKCELRKQLKKTENNPVNHDSRLKFQEIDHFVIQNIESALEVFFNPLIIVHHSYSQENYDFQFTEYVHKPPIA